MFNSRVIESSIEKLWGTWGTPGVLPRELSIAEADDLTRRLAKVVDEKGVQLRPLDAEEQALVRNEILMCKASWRYWAERYAYISKGASTVERMYPLFATQEFILDRIAEVELRTFEGESNDGILINLLKGARQVGGCLRPSTRVLTADLRWIPLEDVQLGMELVAVDESTPGGKGKHRKMRRTVVEAKRELIAPTFRIMLENGGKLIATGDHRFLSHARKGTTTCWRQVSQMDIGDRIRFITPTWEGGSFEDGWLGGMIDGEGSLRRRTSQREGRIKAGGCELAISQVAGPVFDRVTRYFDDNDIVYRHDIDNREAGESSKLGNKPVHKTVMGRLDDIFKVIGMTRPTRFVNSGWWEGREPPGTKDQGWSKIVSIEALSPERVIDLQTGTKTYIAEGFVSHNSTFAEVVGAHKFTLQSDLHGLIAADEPGTSAHLFDMFERVVARLPWWLKPQVIEHVKDREMLFDTGSHIWMGAGKSTRGTEGQRGQLGRGKTLSYVHLSEVSTWEAASQIDSALFFAIPRTSRVFCMLESTAKGRHNWWHEHWETSKKGGMTPAGTFECVFIPWYAARDLSKYSVVAPPLWSPSEHTLKIAKITEETSPRWMKKRVVLTREQLYWYEATRSYYEAKDDLSTFLEEVGSADDDETFQHSGNSVFGNAMIQKIRESARPLAAVLEVGPWAELKPGPEPTERVSH